MSAYADTLDLKDALRPHMAAVRGLADGAATREAAEYIFRNLMQHAQELSRRHGFSLGERSDERRARDGRVKERRRG